MSKEEVVRVPIPKSMFEIATNLGMVKVGEVCVHLHSENMIIKEALARGLRLMMIEKLVGDELTMKYAKKNAVSIYASLLKESVKTASETTGVREALAGLPEAEVNGVGRKRKET